MKRIRCRRVRLQLIGDRLDYLRNVVMIRLMQIDVGMSLEPLHFVTTSELQVEMNMSELLSQKKYAKSIPKMHSPNIKSEWKTFPNAFPK